MTDDERAIRQVAETWIAASKCGDLATVLSLMTEDVIFMVPGQEPFGRDAFATASRNMAGVTMEGTSEVLELLVIGDWAFVRNRLVLAVTAPGSTLVRRSGYTLTLLRKESGRWLLARDANLLTMRS
jgi:uncharacterized protein (TIGR02246 family)